MSLAETQQAFLAQVLDEDARAPTGWTDRHRAGLSIYRNNYRSALVDALRSTFERTERWVGEDAFQRAAAHHIISHPPDSWTLDEAGRGFERTCAELFANDPEVADLAWLEWAMLDVFTAADVAPMDGDGFGQATAGSSEEDWSQLRLKFIPGLLQRAVHHDVLALWNALTDDQFDRFDAKLDQPATCIVWREGERPVFSLVDPEEGTALEAMNHGATFEQACTMMASDAEDEDAVQEAAMRAGAMLGRWLNDGLIAGITTSAA